MNKRVGVFVAILGIVLVLVSVVFFAFIGLTQKASVLNMASDETSITVPTLVERLIDAIKHADDGDSNLFFDVLIPNSLTLAFYLVAAIVMLTFVIKALINHIAYFKNKTNAYITDKSALAAFMLYVNTAFIFRAGWSTNSQAMGSDIVCDFDFLTFIGLVVCSALFCIYIVVRVVARNQQPNKGKTAINVLFNFVMIACSYAIMYFATSALLGYSILDNGADRFGYFGWYSRINTGSFHMDGKSIQDLGQLLTGLTCVVGLVLLEGINIKAFALEMGGKIDIVNTKGKRRQITANPYVSLLLSVALAGLSIFTSYRMIKDDANSSVAFMLPIVLVAASLVNVLLHIVKNALTKDKSQQVATRRVK